MSFGKQMRLRREELHLSRAALAEELGVSPSAISNYENGVSSPKEEVLLRLFDALEIDPNYLYRDSFRSGSFVCSRAEQDLIEKCRSLSPLERETVGSLVSALCTMHARQAGAGAPRRIPLYRSIEADAIERAVDKTLRSGFRCGDIMQENCQLVGCKAMGAEIRSRI